MIGGQNVNTLESSDLCSSSHVTTHVNCTHTPTIWPHARRCVVGTNDINNARMNGELQMEFE